MDLPPYTCTGMETSGVAEFFDQNNNYVTALQSSACFANWYCLYLAQQNEGAIYTWSWRGGIDPDDPTTWPGYEPPEEP